MVAAVVLLLAGFALVSLPAVALIVLAFRGAQYLALVAVLGLVVWGVSWAVQRTLALVPWHWPLPARLAVELVLALTVAIGLAAAVVAVSTLL